MPLSMNPQMKTEDKHKESDFQEGRRRARIKLSLSDEILEYAREPQRAK